LLNHPDAQKSLSRAQTGNDLGKSTDISLTIVTLTGHDGRWLIRELPWAAAALVRLLRILIRGSV
jgi:hypothetical protein